jgi:regulator of extracellular matrix RemA (YlzA/DUF370 family)
MRAICIWDGSGHAMAALEQVVPLFRAQALSHVEIMMLVWPQRESAMWRDILEQHVVTSDLHRAAAEISTAYGNRLRAVILPTAKKVHVSIVDADTVPAIRKAIVELRADIVFLILGSVQPDSQIATNMRELLHENTVPLWVLHAPARTQKKEP